MKKSRSREDYLEAIFLLSKDLAFIHQIDIARYMEVSQPAVEKAIRHLEEDGYLKLQGLHIVLTSSGEDYAAEIYRKHSIICNFLNMHGIDEEIADKDACEIEHVISSESVEMMASWIKKQNKSWSVCPITGLVCGGDDGRRCGRDCTTCTNCN